MLSSLPTDSSAVMPAAPSPASSGGPVATDAATAATPATGFADLLASFAPAPEAAPLPPAQLPQPPPVLLWQFPEQLKVPVSTPPAALPNDTESALAEVDENEEGFELAVAENYKANIDLAYFFRLPPIVQPAPALKSESTITHDAPVDPVVFRAVASPISRTATSAPPAMPPPAPAQTPALPASVQPAPAPALKSESTITHDAPVDPVLFRAVSSPIFSTATSAPPAMPPTAPGQNPALPVAVAPTPMPTIPTSAAALPYPGAATIPAITTVPEGAPAAFAARTPAGITLPTDVIAPASPNLTKAPAQISALVPAGSSGEGQGTPSENKNRSQGNGNKSDESVIASSGTGRAYEQFAMSSSPATFAVPAAVARLAEAMTPTPAAAAVRLVERVAEAANQLSARPSEPISLSIQLDDTHRVDVSVSLRDGRVHTSFSSDSADVRAALSAAWQGFVRSPERAEQKWAEPVFASLGSAPTVASPQALAPVSEARLDAGLSGQGQDSQGRRQAAEPRNDSFSAGSSRSSGFVNSANPVSIPSASRADTSRHLSAVA